MPPTAELARLAAWRPTGTADERDRWIALVVLCIGMLMIVLDDMHYS